MTSTHEELEGTCRKCGRLFAYQQHHAGFGNQGFMYCDCDETVLTWDAYDPRYRRVTSELPWMLDQVARRAVEEAIRPCPYGGGFAFVNPPLCPVCYESIAYLVPSREYFLITGRRLHADGDDMWLS